MNKSINSNSPLEFNQIGNEKDTHKELFLSPQRILTTKSIVREGLTLDNIQLIKRCVNRIKFTSNYKSLSQASQFQKSLVGDLASDLENTIVDQIYDPLSRVRRKDNLQTFRELSLSLFQKMKKKQLEGILYQYFRYFQNLTIDPTGYFIFFWNFLNMVIIIHNIFVIPLQDAFTIDFTKGECQLSKYIITLELFAMVIDIMVQFNVRILRGGEILDNKREITMEYLQSGFIFDFLSLIGFVVNRNDEIFNNNCQWITYGSEKIIVRYLYMLKLYTLQQLMGFFQQHFSYSNKLKNYIKLVKLLFTMLFLAHLFACLWIIVGFQSAQSFKHLSWLQNLYECTKFQLYLKSMYFCVMTMTTVGYGDIVPINEYEYLCCIMLMISSSAIFAYSLNTINRIISDLHAQTKVYNHDIEQIGQYMRKRKIDPTLQARIRNYLKCIQDAGLNEDADGNTIIMNKLSGALRSQLLLSDKGMIFKDTIFDSHFSPIFLSRLLDRIQEVRFSPGENVKRTDSQHDIFDESLIYVQNGQLELSYENIVSIDHKDKTKKVKLFQLSHGESFGLISLFSKPVKQQKLTAVSRGFTILYMIKKRDFEDLLYSDDFNNSDDKITYCYIRDRVRYNDKTSQFKLKCQVCLEQGHEFQDCKKFFFIPNKSILIQRVIHSIDQTRQKMQRYEKKQSQTLKILAQVKSNALKLQRNQTLEFYQSKKLINYSDNPEHQIIYEEPTVIQSSLDLQNSQRDIVPLSEQSEMIINSQESINSWMADADEQSRIRQESSKYVSRPPKDIIKSTIQPFRQSTDLITAPPQSQQFIKDYNNYGSKVHSIKHQRIKPEALEYPKLLQTDQKQTLEIEQIDIKKKQLINMQDTILKSNLTNDMLDGKYSLGQISSDKMMLEYILEFLTQYRRKQPQSNDIQSLQNRIYDEFDHAKEFQGYFEENNLGNVLNQLKARQKQTTIIERYQYLDNSPNLKPFRLKNR